MTVSKDPERRELAYLRKLCSFEQKRILELGAGEGRLTWQYAAHTDRVVGIDLDHEALRIARVDCPADLHERADLAQASASRLPFRRGCFDLALFAWSF